MKKGMTLVEVLISMTIMSIMVFTFSSIYGTGLGRLRQELAQTQLQTEAQTALDRIITEIKESRNVEQVFESQNLSSTFLPLKIPAVDQNQNFLYNGGNYLYDNILYTKDANNLKRKVIANPSSKRYGEAEKVLLNNVSELTFTYIPDINNPDQVSVALTLTKTVGKQTKSVTVKSSAKFRNNL